MNFIKQNWKQILTAVASCGVAAGLLFHKLTPEQAVYAGSLLAALGIHLPAVTYSVKP